MRPIKLTISAFGPYAEKQILDFRELNGRNIFVITGATGSGKTTIFDAISYALYGEASGEFRDNDSLRSHFADDDTETYVELEFELRGEVYKILRSPKQMRKKTRGEGYTEKEAEAELILPNGKVITKVNNVTKKITEVLGITKEQFKQIVMLPQGEFKKLLLASSVERESIFRKIFNTYNFERIQLELKDKAVKLSKERNLCKDKMKTYLENIKGNHNISIGDYIDFDAVIEGLKELINEEKIEYKNSEKELSSIQELLQNKNKEKLIGEQNNKLIEEKRIAKKSLEELLLKRDIFIENKKIVDKGKKAKEVNYIEEGYIQSKDRLEKREKYNEVATKNIEKIEKELKKLEVLVKSEEDNEGYRTKLTEEIGILKGLEPKIKDFENNKKLLISLDSSIKCIKVKIDNNDKKIKELKKDKEVNEKVLKDINDLSIKSINLKTEIEKKNTLIEDIRKVFKCIDKYEKVLKEHSSLEKKYGEFEKIYKGVKSEYENMEEIYRKEQAGILAKTLKKGSPCPVCGSLDHPNPAINNNLKVPTEEELKIKREEFKKLDLENNEKIIELTKVNSNKNNYILNVNDALSKISKIIDIEDKYNKDSYEIVKEKGISLKDDIDNLNKELKSINNKINKKEIIEKTLQNIENEIKDTEKLIEELNKEDKEIFAKLESANTSIRNLKKEIPEEVETIEVLTKLIKLKELNLEESKKKLAIAINNRDNCIKVFEGEKSTIKEISKNIEEIKEEIKLNKEKFHNTLRNEGFISLEEYISCKKYIVDLEKLSNEIEEYKKQVELLNEKVKDLTEKCKDIKILEIEKINEVIKNLTVDKTEKESKVREEYSILQNNMNVLKKVKELNIKFREKEEEYKVIGELSELANGKKGPYISFERYVLASYFQDIIDAANLRLEKMTGDRFILKRKTSKSKGAGQKGLELEIFDNYTASSRDVSSLSGGESFKASLSLALGLSDVVQSSSGGVSLETMFVDEGFGTLDPQSLDSAIDSLLDLQRGGRLVGIISHVEELKERLDAKLEVSATQNGSRAKFNVL
ncbi:exonuclease SbcC [Clostridium moniliforme]|uniref:Nuclease SbcCD subunit C n=1 Tax=Clostridium moniliforme TaxID=39489 RepID=A0ABS4F1L8_9CLOT|nr:AAA family ATPase [Clostridium moniliforme]MBP1890150.1 exonuclease SbcC [Clostridium moniliforme]